MNESPESASSPSPALRDIDLFQGLDDGGCEHVGGLIKWRQYPKGAEVVSHRSGGDDVYIIASGRVRATIFTYGGKEISYQELGPGETFGELSAIDRQPRTATIITLQAARIGTITRKDYWDIVTRYPEVARAALQRLARLVRFLVDRVYQYGALDVKGRVRMELLRLARANAAGEDRATITDFPTHHEIANRIISHREAVSRELSDLRRQGLIRQDKRELTVTSVAKLASLLEDSMLQDTE